jgi:hypothetical protein
VRQRAQLIRAHRGVLTIADLIRSTGQSRREAEHEMAMLVGRLGGDVAVTEQGEVLYLFPDLARRAVQEESTAARERLVGHDGAEPFTGESGVPTSYEGLRPLTGNSAGANATIAGLATVTLLGGLAGGALFERFGILGTLPLMLGSWIPAIVGLVFLLVPPLRGLPLSRENLARAQRDARRAMLDMHRKLAPVRSMADWVDAIAARMGDRADRSLIERIVRDVGSDFGADVDGATDQLRYRFPALATALTAGLSERRERRLDRSIAADVAFSTADDEPPADPS